MRVFHGGTCCAFSVEERMACILHVVCRWVLLLLVTSVYDVADIFGDWSGLMEVGADWTLVGFGILGLRVRGCFHIHASISRLEVDFTMSTRYWSILSLGVVMVFRQHEHQ